jgi:UDP-GlcNAc:undecaprenyl-phosphate/decaprenyl-phosphate GlcNAc-1-phosphate transferase
MIIEYFITMALSFIIAFSATPIAKKVAFAVGAVDIPNDGRRMHKNPIARMGGLAIISGFLISILFDILNISGFEVNRQLTGLLAGVSIILVMGIIDDVKPVNAKIKLMFQILAAATAILISDIRIERLTNPFADGGYSVLSPYISYPLTVLWIAGITNAINLIDGLDGLATGICTISFLSFFFISIIRSDVPPETALFTAIITMAVVGSTLGFLPFNFHPAKIFLGETGAGFLGFIAGFISIQGTVKSYAAISLIVPLIIFGIPVFDILFAILRRLVGKKPIMNADRGHMHHRLIDMGLTHRQCVIFMYIGTGALGLSAIVLSSKGLLNALLLLLPVSIFMFAGAKFMSDINHEHKEQEIDKKHSGDADEKSKA